MNKQVVHNKIAQITWITYTNYGTFLQAFALQQVLNQLGYDSVIIDDSRLVNENISWKSRILIFLSSIYHLNYFKNRKRQKLYDNFASSFLNVDYCWRDYGDVNSRYGIFVCGSDQIWSPLLPNHHNGFYFASFASENAKKIAYAPSLGCKTIPKAYASLTSKWLYRFAYLSARETSGTKILEEITGRKDIETVIDPTLLLSSEQWSNFEKTNSKLPSKIYGRHYLLAYFLTKNTNYISIAKKIAKEKRLTLVAINSINGLSKYFDIIINCGPMEFLSVIANAQYVVTDSFHGSIFAIHFKRPFLTLKRFTSDAPNSQNARIENLFAKLEICDNFLGEEDKFIMPKEPNWSYIEELLKSERSLSINYLKTALSNG